MKYTTTQELYSIFKEKKEISTDTRSIKKESLFFALKGANFNGNTFALTAIQQGASYAIVDDEKLADNKNCLLVPDALTALQDLAKYHRQQLTIPIIAITGSNGKTTTKELIREVLATQFSVYATIGNLNNHIGVPLTLLSINETHQMAVVEMGANHQKEIEFLCNIALPDYGLITNIGKAHLEGFGGIEGVIKGKTEMYTYIRENNKKLFVNEDDQLLMDLSKNCTRTTYGISPLATTQGALVVSEPFVAFVFEDINKNKQTVSSNLVGVYNLPNLLAACAIGNYFSVSGENIKKAIEKFTPTNSRSQQIIKGSNTIILDAYNANPTSMIAAIINFANIDAENKIVILGDMLELGDSSLKEHQHIVNILKQNQLTDTVLVGPFFNDIENIINAKLFKTSAEACEFLKKMNVKNSTVLIKGSRGTKMEEVLNAFAD
ncbi:MAG: UDP-N-acetylmuramoyl-tripeptide--D-alanyl-D-alanine ligase [Bacteroidota bacterium]